MSDVKHKAHIDGLFQGFCPQSLFKLKDGTFWLQIDSKTLITHQIDPKAKILAQNNDRFLKVAGTEQMVQVQQLHDVIETRIRGKFSGWSGKSAYTLMNGQTWQQTSHLTKYMAKYMPVVLIYNSAAGPVMHVAGTSVRVRKIN